MKNTPFRIAVLASTNGTDLQAIIDELKDGKMPGIELALVASNRKSCYAIQRAKEQGYKTVIIRTKNRTREQFDTKLAEVLTKYQLDLIVLVGYMRLLTPEFVQQFHRKIINVHPSLIPKYCGKDAINKSVHEAVIANKETETGMTIHYVDEDLDSGDIITQKSCPVLPDDTPETLKARVQELEKTWYPEVIRQLAQKQ